MLATSPDPTLQDALPDELSGDFEVHLTVCPRSADALADWAAEHGLGFTHIVLARGAAASQPMLTLRGSGQLHEVAARAERTAERLSRAGFTVLRVKIEAAPWAHGVPQSDDDAARHGAARYFEHHVKLLLPAAADTAAVTELAARHASHLSRNARRVRPDGLRERFVTQRARLVGLATAGRRLDALLADLAAGGWQIASVEREYVVFDSDEALDAGWIDERTGTQEKETPR